MKLSALAIVAILLVCCTTSAADAGTNIKSGSKKTQETEWVTFPISKGGKGVPLNQWLKENPLKDDQDILFEEISRGETASTHLVVIKQREPLHVHAGHDLIAILLKGEGTLTVGGQELQVKPGSIITIPRGVPHSFLNKTKEPAVAYALFTPPFDGKDMQPVKEQAPETAVRKK